MIDKLLLALRNDGHRVSVIRREGETGVQLGVRHPDEQGRRVKALRQWGIEPDSPRRETLATIDQALPRRAQTVLSYRVEPALQRRLASGADLPAQGRVASRAGPHADAGLDPDPS